MADYHVKPLDSDVDFDRLPYWDVVIVGAGPAGLTAGLTTAHRGLTTLIIEAKDQAGGQPRFLYPDKKIVDIPGFPDGITGDELSDRVYRQARDAMVQFRFQEEVEAIEETDHVEKNDTLKRVFTSAGSYRCRKVILACGLLHFPRRMPVLDRLESKNVYYKVPRIGDYSGRHVVIVGGGDSALDAAVMVLQRNGTCDLLVRKSVRGKQSTLDRVRALGGKVRTGVQISSAGRVEDGLELTLTDGSKIRADWIIVQIGYLSPAEKFKRFGLRLNQDGSVAVDPYYETNRRGIFAVGDVHGDIRLVTVAWAEGIQAAIYAFKEITSPYWLNEKRLRDLKIALIGEKIAQDAERKK